MLFLFACPPIYIGTGNRNQKGPRHRLQPDDGRSHDGTIYYCSARRRFPEINTLIPGAVFNNTYSNLYNIECTLLLQLVNSAAIFHYI